MSKLLWLIGGTALVLAVYTVLNSGEDSVADTADLTAGRIGGWGLKQRATGTGAGVLGTVKKAAGDLTGDESLSGEGVLDQAAGKVLGVAGKAAQAVSSTIHDLNK